MNKQKIHTEFDAMGLKLRFAKYKDVEAIDNLAALRYSREIAREVSPYESIRCIDYGRIFLLESLGELVACQYLIPYISGSEKIAYGMRLLIKKEYEGRGLAKRLFQYSAIEAKELECTSLDSLVSIQNDAIHSMLLNNFGARYTSLIDENLTGVYMHLTSRLQLLHQPEYRVTTAEAYQRYISRMRAEEYKLVQISNTAEIIDTFRNWNGEVALFVQGCWDQRLESSAFLFRKPERWRN